MDNGANLICLSIDFDYTGAPASFIGNTVRYANDHQVVVVSSIGIASNSLYYSTDFDKVIKVGSVDQFNNPSSGPKNTSLDINLQRTPDQKSMQVQVKVTDAVGNFTVKSWDIELPHTTHQVLLPVHYQFYQVIWQCLLQYQFTKNEIGIE